MATTRFDQARFALPVAEQNEVFAQHPYGLRRRAGVAHETDRMPVAPQQFAHRLAAAYLGERGIVG